MYYRLVVFGMLVLGSYPDYCSKPDALSTRSIPPLTPSAKSLNLTLHNVQAVVRHGSRTPTKHRECWPGYDPEWRCDVRESVASIMAEKELTSTVMKVFDANTNLNALPGTCGMSQILADGIQQGKFIGSVLASAYLDTSMDMVSVRIPSPSSPSLLESEHMTDEIYIRSSNYQRTISTAASVFTGALEYLKKPLEPAVVHTMDEDLDYIYPNWNECPLTRALHVGSFNTPGFTDFLKRNKKTYALLQREMNFKKDGDFYRFSDPLDCLMTSICNDYSPIPTSINENMKDVLAFLNAGMAFHYPLNDAQYAIIGTQTWRHDMTLDLLASITKNDTKLEGLDVDDDDLASEVRQRHSLVKTPRRLTLHAAHDVSLLGLLHTLVPDVKMDIPPYASLLVIELFESTNSPLKYFFRLVYNGQVMTDQVEGCAGRKVGDVCPFTYLLKRLLKTGSCDADAASGVHMSVPGADHSTVASFAVLGLALGVALGACSATFVMNSNDPIETLRAKHNQIRGYRNIDPAEPSTEAIDGLRASSVPEV